jgi:cyclophilin family peptidyl-prolyl cis-trans isomerase
MPKITHTVYLDVQIMSASAEKQAEPPTRIMIGLFGDVMPKTVENFVALCEGTNGGSLSYAGTTFYRVLSGLTVQGGAIGPNTKSGKTGLSSFPNGDPFEPDNYNIQHSHSDGLVCMVRGLGGSVDSRFFIHTNADGGWANDRYAAFGMVLNEDGLDFIHKKMDKVEVKPPSNIPVTPIQIVASGVLTTPQACSLGVNYIGYYYMEEDSAKNECLLTKLTH